MSSYNFLAKASAVAMSFALAACGGGGTPVISAPPPAPAPTPAPTPTPTPAPSPTPAPTPSDVSDLASDQSFAVGSGNQIARYNLGSGDTLASQSSTGSIQIDYDASTDSYAITSDGRRNVIFTPSDEVDIGETGRRRFQISDGGQSEFLTLVYSGYGSNLRTKSVALGFWQSNIVDGMTQDTDFDAFVYGFPSGASAIPKTGSADFQTDVFGFSSQLGREPMSFQGTGTTVFDFARGTFAMETNISENFLFSGGGRSGALYFNASGNLSSSSNAFDGSFFYDGSGDPIVGLLNGSFFGVNATEAGGTFAGDDLVGNSVVGGFTAASRGDSRQNLSVYDLTADQLFYTAEAGYEQRRYKNGSPGFVSPVFTSNNQLSYRASDKSFRVSGFVEDEGRFTPADLVSPASAEFDVYRINAGAEDIELAIYQPANGSEIALTYSGFGVYRRTFEDAAQFNFTQDWFLYGLAPPEGVLDARSGTGTYNGVARGVAGSTDGMRQLNVTGTSQFVIDFAARGYAGWLRLRGTDTANGAEIDFGQFNLAEGNTLFRSAFTTALQQGGDSVGEIQLRFYGPTGEEMAGVFGINTTGFGIAGATAAKRE